MKKQVSRPGVQKGYDFWAATYDTTSNPLVALDRRHTDALLNPKRGEMILDAGCGTGAHLKAIRGAEAEPVGMDFSRGMLQVARRSNPGVPLAQADLNRPFPIAPGRFDGLVCALVSDHLKDLGLFFDEAISTLRPGGRIVFSAFHPDMAAAGVEANFQADGVEYRLGAEPHRVDDYLNHMDDAGFSGITWKEHVGDERLAKEVPGAVKYLGKNLLLTVEAVRPWEGN